MVIPPHVIDRQPYPGNPAVRDEKGGLRKRDYGSRIWVLRESWSEAAGLRNGSGRPHPNRPPDPEGARVAFLSQSAGSLKAGERPKCPQFDPLQE